jgi:DNA helicase-2/ATP-dependent DNA helicase PcrA
MHAISSEKGKGVTAAAYAEKIGNDYFPKIVAGVWAEYEKMLAAEKALDLDDLLLVAAQLLKKNPAVREQYQKQWKYIHIDEYQDTNTVQYQIARLLSDAHKNICVVGDADQNIYSWRGADISNILRFEKDFPNAKVVLLEENYRSTKTILNAANQVIKKNKVRIEKNLFTQKGTGEHISLFESWNEIQESQFVAAKTLSLIESGISPDEIAVLYRANFQSRTLEEWQGQGAHGPLWQHNAGKRSRELHPQCENRRSDTARCYQCR